MSLLKYFQWLWLTYWWFWWLSRVIYVRRSIQVLARSSDQTRSFHHQILYLENSNHQWGNFPKDLGWQDFLMENRRYLNLLSQIFWTVPSLMTGVLAVKNLVVKTLFGRKIHYLEGSPYINNIALAIKITNVSTIVTGKYLSNDIPMYTSSFANICTCTFLCGQLHAPVQI